MGIVNAHNLVYFDWYREEVNGVSTRMRGDLSVCPGILLDYCVHVLLILIPYGDWITRGCGETSKEAIKVVWERDDDNQN